MSVEGAFPQLRYDIAVTEAGFRLSRSDVGVVGNARDLGQLLYVLDSDIVIQLQRMRPDLLFLHAAVLTLEGSAHVLPGRSGAGKSTTCWGLLHRGLGYLSDELAPIHTPLTSRGYHVSVSHMPTSQSPVLHPVRTVFFVDYDSSRRAPTIRAIGRAEAAARLYPNALNALAHEDDAMSAVTRVTKDTRAYVVDAAELGATCDLIRATLDS